MKKQFVLAIVLVSTLGCSRGGLSDKDALRLISEAEGYPKVIIEKVQVPKGGELHKEISALAEAGEFKPHVGYIHSIPGDFEASEAYADKIHFADFNRFHGDWWQFYVYSHRAKVGEITDKMIDESSGFATVEYTVEYKPTEYQKHIAKLSPETVSAEREATINKVQFRKWDNGWRIVE